MWEALFRMVESIFEYLQKRTGRYVVEIKYHKFFSEIYRYEKHHIPYISLSFHGRPSQGRTRIFRDMLQIKFSIRRSVMANAILDLKPETMLDKNIKAIDDIINWYNRERKLQWIPDVVIEKFNEWHSIHADSIVKEIEDIITWNSFSSIKEMMHAILYLHTYMVVLTFRDAEKTLWELNGQLTWLVYKGITID